MRHFPIATTFIVAVIAAVAFAPEIGHAQNPSKVPMPPGGFKPPPSAPVKPYKPLAVTPPAPNNDPSFAAFHKQLGEVAQRKDRNALGKLVASQGFFWMQEKDMADKRKSPIANLSAALNLDAKDGSGWMALGGMAEDPTTVPLPDHAGVICGPADPNLDQQAFEALVQSTKTQPMDWAYPTRDGIEVRSAGQPNAAVVEKLGLTMVRVLTDTAPPQDPNQPAFLHIALPSGKTGFVSMDAVGGLGGDQMCYVKEGGNWKITGFFGGANQ
ncbi:MAG TPA: hypothetical protein VGG11_22785 [Xanthobacteraceae bacterium]